MGRTKDKDYNGDDDDDDDKCEFTITNNAIIETFIR